MDRQALKPPFAYYGGKTTLAPKIASMLPAHEHYVEPFAGSLAVLLAKKPSRAETVNDLDGDLMTFWRVLRDRPDELERVCALTPHSRAEFAAAKIRDDVDDLERARRVWVQITQNRTHSLRGGAPADWKFRKQANPLSRALVGLTNRLDACAVRLQGVALESRDANVVIADYGSEPTACIYADPPYLGTTRGGGYGVEMTADDQHETFAQVCHDAKAAVVISGYDSPLYDRLFDGWHRYELKAPTTLSGDTDRVEVLWSNRQLVGAQTSLFDEVTA